MRPGGGEADGDMIRYFLVGETFHQQPQDLALTRCEVMTWKRTLLRAADQCFCSLRRQG